MAKPKVGDVFQLGELNPRCFAATPSIDMARPEAMLDLLIGASKESYKRTATNCRGPKGWQAMCLRVSTGPKQDAILQNAIMNRNPNGGVSTEAAEMYIIVKAFIPDLHAGCPLPRTLPAFHEKSEDHDWINRFFPTNFYALAEGNELPQLGELIWVDYRSPSTFDGGVYNGRVNSKNPQIFFTNSGPLDSPKDSFEAAEEPPTVLEESPPAEPEPVVVKEPPKPPKMNLGPMMKKDPAAKKCPDGRTDLWNCPGYAPSGKLHVRKCGPNSGCSGCPPGYRQHPVRQHSCQDIATFGD